jgi:hypothetical protein
MARQNRENPVGGNTPSGAEGATAPVNSQAQGTVLIVTLWRVVPHAPADGITISGAPNGVGTEGASWGGDWPV